MKSYRQLCDEIAELNRQISELYDRYDPDNDPYCSVIALIDDLEEQVDELVDERDQMIHRSLGF